MLKPNNSRRERHEMSNHGREIFPDPEIMRLVDLLKIKQRWQARYLANVLRSLPETVGMFRGTRFAVPPSRTEIFLHRICADPTSLHRFLEAKYGSTRASAFDRALQDHDGLALLHYHTALVLARGGRAEVLLRKGTARRALLKREIDNVLVQNAAQSAIGALDRKIRRGKGSDRRSTQTVPQLIAEYLLEVYADVTGRQPRVRNNMITGTIEGPAVWFLTVALSKAGVRVPSGSTLRRWIDGFRRRKDRPY